MMGVYRHHLGLYLVLASLFGIQVASQNGCKLLKNEFIIDVSLTEATQGDPSNSERRFLGFRGAAGSIELSVEQEDSTIDFDSNFRIFLGIADFNYGYCIQRIGDVDRDGKSPKYSDDNSILEYTIVCKDLKSSNKYYYPLLIRISDVNDNKPIFQNEPYEVTIDKNTKNGSTVLRVKATDKDVNRNRHVVYGIESGSGSLNDASQYFQFPVISSGALALKKNIDIGAFKREGISSMTLNIYAMDMGRNSLRSDSSVKINIQYDTDVIVPEVSRPVTAVKTNCVLVNKPHFQNGEINIKIPEVSSLSELSAHPHRYRAFIGIEDTVSSLSLSPSTTTVGTEYVIPRSGPRGYHIRFKGIIDRDGETSDTADDQNYLKYNLTCVSNGVTKVFPVVIHVTDVNDNTPILEESDLEFNVQSEISAPVEVYNIYDHSSVTDSDQGVNREIIFDIEAGDGSNLDASKYFSVDGRTGVISQINNIPYDELLESGSTTLYINVSISDNAKNVNNIRTSHSPIKVNVLFAGTTTTFIPLRCDLSKGRYDIDEHGNIKMAMFETSDDADLQEDVDLHYVYIGEDASAQLSIAPAPGSSFNPAGYFQFYTRGKRQFMKLVKHLDRDGDSDSADDDTDMVEFLIKCKKNGPVDSYHVYLTIEDINDNSPVFQNTPYSVEISELTEAGQTLFDSILATDKDNAENREIHYDIVPGDGSETDMSQYFEIPDPLKGEVILVKPLDYEQLSSFTLNISAYNGFPHVDRRTVYTGLEVNVIDEDDQVPIFIYDSCIKTDDICTNPEYTSNIPSGINAGRLMIHPVPELKANTIINIEAKDQDTLGTSLIFTIDESKPSGYTDYFTIETMKSSDDKYMATIKQAEVINRADVTNLKLIIKAQKSSSNNLFATATIHIDVTPTNLNPPSLSSSSGSFIGYVSEAAPPGTYVQSSADDPDTRLQIIVSDPDILPTDPRSNYSFSINEEMFKIDNDGFIQTAASLDAEVFNEVEMNVAVTESDTKEMFSVFVPVVIKILNINDNSPVFTQRSYNINITEGDYTDSPHNILKVTAADADGMGDISYIIAQVTPDNGDDLFTIDDKTGEIYVVGQLPPDVIYSLNIHASDNGEPPRSTVTMVKVFIQAKPNSSPYFSQSKYIESIDEASSIGSEVVTVSAMDSEDDELIYAITSGNIGQTFAIDSSSGVVSVTKTLDYETVNEFELRVTATDPKGLEASAVINIDITDSNDNVPVFTSTSYEASVIEGDYSSAHKTVLEVSASDLDSGENGHITYSISKLHPEHKDKITINPDTGAIDLIGKVRGDTTYTITVKASDAGDPPKRSTTRVSISIIPVTETNNAPVIPQSIYTISVSEGTAIDSQLVQISASDPDGDELKYSIISQSPDNQVFEIDQTGTITNVKKLDREEVVKYTLHIQVEDDKALSAQSQVFIIVTDMNDNAPIFDKDVYEFSMPEGKLTSVMISATDLDIGINSMITYSLPEPVENFEISADGKLSTTRPLDREDIAEYKFPVVATDNGLPVLSSTATVQVHVTDIPDSIPIFDPSVYEAFVPEGVADYLVTTIKATDADENQNIVYIFEEGDISDFVLDSVNGEIRTRKPLDVKSKPFYSFTVTTTDGEGLNSALVSVTVKNPDEIEPTIIVSEPIVPDESVPTTQSNITRQIGDDLAPVFTYPTCIKNCIRPEYAAAIQSATSLFPLTLYPMPSDNPTHKVPLQARDPNTPHNELVFTIERTVPAGLAPRFSIERKGPFGTGHYKAVIEQKLPLYVEKTPKVEVVVRSTEQSKNKLYAEASIYIDVRKEYVLEAEALSGGVTTRVSFISLFSILLICVYHVLYL